MKAIHKVDMPKRCVDCPFHDIVDIADKPFCFGDTDKVFSINDDSFYIERDERCPLKPIPKIQSETSMSGEPDLEAHGWNLCIEELEK